MQDKLRVEQYSGLADAVATAKSAENGNNEQTRIGQLTILPASHTGSPRYMYKHYLDALAIAGKYRKFDLFITITGNPKWSGVTENILPGQQPTNRPDIVHKVFKHVLDELMADIGHGIFGQIKAKLYTVEGQMRGTQTFSYPPSTK
jgi:hypothetical protein